MDNSTAPSNADNLTAAQQIDALLARTDPDYMEQPAEKPESASEAPQAEEQPEQDSEAEVKADEAEEETQEAEAEEAEELELDPDEALFEVEETQADGSKEVKKYSLNDLRSQRMLQSDYTRKTQELAKQRAEVQNSLEKGINEQRTQYVQALEAQQQAFMELLAPEVKNLDELANEDPAAYVQAQHRISKYQDAIKQVETRKQEAIQQQQEFIKTKVLPEQMELLKTKIPEWSKEKETAVIETGKSFGLTDEELGSMFDHRHVHILHELNRLQKLEKTLGDKKAIASKKVVEKPKTAIKSAGKQKQPSRSEESMTKLKKTGRWQDAVGVIAEGLHDIQ